MQRYIQLNNYIISRKLTQSLPCTPIYTTLVRDCFRTALLASVTCSQPFHSLNLSYLSPTVLNIRWQIKPQKYGYEPSVTDASKPKKQIYQKRLATPCHLFRSM